MARLIHRGEIRWYRFRQPDKNRPVLILTRESALGFLRDVTVAPVTSTIRDIPSEVVLTGADGLPSDCAVNLDHLQTVPAARIGRLIASLPAHRLEEVRSALLFATGFNRVLVSCPSQELPIIRSAAPGWQGARSAHTGSM